MSPADYLAIAAALLNANAGNPGQAALRRAVSTAYYAVFYAMCQNTADCFIGPAGAGLLAQAWQQAFRAVDHGFARHQCRNQQVMAGFPPEIQSFANGFVWLQEQRHAADYNPGVTFDLGKVRDCLDEATQAIAALNAAPEDDRRAFAAWVALRHRP